MSAAGEASGACRNCGASIAGPYCAQCGQETTIALPTARQFLREAAGRYALDGRLWRTLVALLTRPGFLTREYFDGRRRRYIRPARLFLVLSLALFAALRLVAQTPVVIDDATTGDSSERAKTTGTSASAPAAQKPDATGKKTQGPVRMNIDEAEFDLGEIGTMVPEIGKRLDRFKHLSNQDKADQILGGMIRYGPYAMFALLPCFALLLQIAYLGPRRRYPGRPRKYAQHLVFAAHNHAFLFVIAIVGTALPVEWLRVVLWGWAAVYLAWSTHSVYGGRWSGVIARGVIIALAYLILFSLATLALVLAAALLR